MVLEVETNARKLDLALDASLLQLLGITDTGALKNKWGTEGSARDDDCLAGFDDPLLRLLGIDSFSIITLSTLVLHMR